MKGFAGPRESGFALILVLWSLILMTSLATGFSYAVRHETRVATDLVSLVRAEAASTAALHQAIIGLTSKSVEKRWQADALVHKVLWEEAAIEIRVRSANSRIDLNLAPRELLIGLFAQRLVDDDPEALADAVIDWRDSDDRPGTAGAEEAAYSRAGYTYGPPNRPFQSVNELRQVIGMDDRKLDAVMPYLTIHGGNSRISASSADAVVLTSVPGIGQSDVEEFIAGREAASLQGDNIDYSALEGGKRYLDTRGRSAAYLMETNVRLDDGFVLREQILAQLHPRLGVKILERNRLPASESPAR